jgi:uncharacterized protein YndB with AHSA1/START domain
MHLPAPPERVFAALDSDEGRAAFWAEEAVEAGGAIAFRFASGARMTARILERRPPNLFVVEYFGSPARFELSGDGNGGTDLLLTHEDVEAGDWHEVHAGWLNVLFPLKAYVAHGVDLRNHDRRRTWDEGYADS